MRSSERNIVFRSGTTITHLVLFVGATVFCTLIDVVEFLVLTSCFQDGVCDDIKALSFQIEFRRNSLGMFFK